ncbi:MULTISPECIES: hypothetical protein [Lacticaseibacillus]|uniref:hypothetical protein n=1 Tax=Lacticaseibacillus TaxID=2759736 RepID=UPI00194235E4|nr:MULTISPECIES: hypothetical protein [Lacticaseibacillus]
MNQTERLMEIINQQQTTLEWVVGIFIALIFGVVGFLGYLQYRYSDTQLKKNNEALIVELEKKFHLDAIEKFIGAREFSVKQAVADFVLFVARYTADPKALTASDYKQAGRNLLYVRTNFEIIEDREARQQVLDMLRAIRNRVNKKDFLSKFEHEIADLDEFLGSHQ